MRDANRDAALLAAAMGGREVAMAAWVVRCHVRDVHEIIRESRHAADVKWALDSIRNHVRAAVRAARTIQRSVTGHETV